MICNKNIALKVCGFTITSLLFSDEFVVNKASLLFEFMFISTTGRSSKLLHQAGGTTQRGLQEGEGEGQQETLRNGIRHFSE